MAPIIPAGGKKMDWVRDPEQPVEKKAQDMFADDPQLQAIKDLPGMQDGIAELQDMSAEVVPPADVPPADVPPVDAPPAVPPAAAPAGGGAVEQAVKKVEDAARAVADAAVSDAKAAVTEAIENVGKPADVAPVSDKPEDISPDKEHEKSETPADEAKEEHEKSESPAKEKKEEECAEDKPKVPGVEGEKDGKVEKEGDKKDDKKYDKPAFAAATGMKRLAELTAEETSELRHYWKDMLGFPGEYVDAMLKKYRA